MDSLRSPYLPVRWDWGSLNRVEQQQLRAIVTARPHSETRGDLLRWAQSNLHEGQRALASDILTRLGEDQDVLAQRARTLKDASLGQGAWVPRLEFLSQDFLKKLSEPAVMGGMLSGAWTYRHLRCATLPFWNSRLGNSWVGGQATRLAASGTGLSGEVAAFLMVEKGLREFSGQPQDWSAATFWQEAQSLGLCLLFLKSFQAVTMGSFYRIHGRSAVLGSPQPLTEVSAWSERALPMGAAVGGLFTGTQVDAWRQGMPGPDWELGFLDALVFSLQYGWSGHLASAMVKGPFAPRRGGPQEGREPVGVPRPTWWEGKVPQWVTPQGTTYPSPVLPKSLSSEAFSRTLKPGGIRPPLPPPHITATKGYRKQLAKNLGLEASAPQVTRILSSILDTDLPAAPEYRRQILLNTYLQAMSVTRFFTIEELSGADILERGVQAIRRAVQFKSHHRVYGTAFDALTERIIHELIPRNQPQVLSDFIRLLALNPHMKHLEEFMQAHGLSKSYQMPPMRNRPHLAWEHPWSKQLDTMVFIGEERRILSQYLATFAEGRQVPSWMRPENNFVELGTGERIPLTPELALAVLKKTNDSLQHYRDGLEILHFVEQALRRADQSPIPWFYFDRLIKVMLTDDPRYWNTMQPRMLELALPDGTHYPQFFDTLDYSMRYTGKDSEALYYTDGSIFSAYINDPRTAQRLLEIIPQIQGLLDVKGAGRRRDKYFAGLNGLLTKSGFRMDREVVLGLLEQSPSRFAHEAAGEIRAGKVDFELVSKDELKPYIHNDHGQTGLFIPPEMRRDGVKNRPLILLLQDHPEVHNTWDLLKRSIDYPRWLIHEYAHYKYDYNESDGFYLHQDRAHQMRGEFRAFLEENYFAMQHGFTREWFLGDVNPYGWAGSLRGLIEQVYWEAPQELWVKPEEVHLILRP